MGKIKDKYDKKKFKDRLKKIRENSDFLDNQIYYLDTHKAKWSD